MEKKNDRNKNTSQNKLYSDEIKEMERLSEEQEKALRERRQARKHRIKKQERRKKLIVLGSMAVVTVVVAVSAVTGIVSFVTRESRQSQVSSKKSAEKDSSEPTLTDTVKQSRPDLEVDERTPEEILADAKLLAVQYDYDKAISLLQKYSGYKKNTEMQDAVKQYEEIKASCKSWPLEEVTHVFYHTLIKDPSKAFDGDYKEADYNQVMTTIDEFNKITETMYEKGYVMVSIYDMAKADADGNITEGEILLPEGKIPFVLSQDDVCYYHYMDGDGYASKLVVDEKGKIRNEYIEDDGSVSVGDYDMVPLIDRFVEEHPDFSYRGAKGIVALTGYNGILGYRTDQSYETRPDDLDANKVEWLDAHPDFSLAKEREGAKKVADAMKAEGRDFVGILFVGLMMTADGPKVLEYNARFGDPEAQVVLPRMKNDIIDVIDACIDGKLDQIDLQFEDNAAVCVVLASDGYPEHYEKGKLISGLEKFDDKDGYYVFHAGTKLTDEGIVTNGGRVLGVTAKGKDLKEARKNAYEATEWISFENKYMRHDIGKAIDDAE